MLLTSAGGVQSNLTVMASDIDISAKENTPPDTSRTPSDPQTHSTDDMPGKLEKIENLDRKSIFPPSMTKKTSPKLRKQGNFEGSQEKDGAVTDKDAVEIKTESTSSNLEEENVYENVNVQSSVYEAIEIRKGRAGRMDLCASGSQEEQALGDLESEIPVPATPQHKQNHPQFVNEEDEKKLPRNDVYSEIPDDALSQDISAAGKKSSIPQDTSVKSQAPPKKTSRHSSKRLTRRQLRKVRQGNGDDIYEPFGGDEPHVVGVDDVEFSGTDSDASYFDSDSFSGSDDEEFSHIYSDVSDLGFFTPAFHGTSLCLNITHMNLRIQHDIFP